MIWSKLNFLKNKNFIKLKHSKILLLIFLLILFLSDFIISGFDPICRSGQGYSFGYPIAGKNEEINQMRSGYKRVKYNFAHFFIFWAKTPFAKTYHNPTEFLSLDTSTIILNTAHFFVFLVLTLILFYFFRLNPILVFIIALLFSIFHEYIAEGICQDPSYNDLWVNLIGILVGVLVAVLWPNYPKLKSFS